MDTSSLMPNSTWPDDPSTNSADYSDYSGYSYPSDPSSYTGSFSPDGCTWEKCGTDYSFFAYRPSRSVNTAFATLFGISALLFLAQGIVSKKRWLGFTVAMICGCILEVVGYVGRIHAYDDPYHDGPFLTQIVCLTIAPAFLAAGIYLCLSRIVTTFSAENSRISPRSYPIIFVTCDFFSLVLQSAGGGIASVKTQDGEDPKLGNNIMIAGLSVQVATLLIFIILALDFTVRTIRRIRQLGAQNALDPRHATLRKSWIFKGFLVALSLSTLCIFIRCVYRVAELSKGWQGHLMKVQRYFIGFEAAVIVAAVYLLNIFHPGFCLGESLLPTAGPSRITGKTWYGRKDVSEQSSLHESKTREETANMGYNGHRVAGQV